MAEAHGETVVTNGIVPNLSPGFVPDTMGEVMLNAYIPNLFAIFGFVFFCFVLLRFDISVRLCVSNKIKTKAKKKTHTHTYRHNNYHSIKVPIATIIGRCACSEMCNLPVFLSIAPLRGPNLITAINPAIPPVICTVYYNNTNVSTHLKKHTHACIKHTFGNKPTKKIQCHARENVYTGMKSKP